MVDNHGADSNTFLYEMKYDTHEKNSLMSTVYVDLGESLSGKKFVFLLSFIIFHTPEDKNLKDR